MWGWLQDAWNWLDDVKWDNWVDVAQVVTAVAGVTIAGLVAFMPHARRPRLRVIEDLDHVNSRVEMTGQGKLPHVRLLVANRAGRRAAIGTRVLVEGYRAQGQGSDLVTLGHPSLEWPSAADAQGGAVTVFGGGARPITLGYFIRVLRDSAGKMVRPVGGLPHFPQGWGGQVSGVPEAWYFMFATGLDIFEDRDKLPPVDDGYEIRLVVGAEDGKAQGFKVDLNWEGDPKLTAEQVLASALDHLAVR